MLSPATRLPGACGRQRGMSLVELLIGITVGMFVVAAASMLTASQLSDNRRLLLETQLHQDLRSSADIIARELRRAGYSTQAEMLVWTPTNTSPAPNAFSPITTASTSVDFKYRRASGQEGPYGFRYNTTAKTLQTQLASAGWQDLTDPRTLEITALSVTEVDGPVVVMPCPKLCADGTQGCWPTITVREFVVDITGKSKSDPAVQRTLRTNVRLRNDRVGFNDAANPTRICPA